MNGFVPMDVNTAKQRIPELTNMLLDRPESLVLAELGTNYFTAGEPLIARPLLEKAFEKNKLHPSVAQNLALTYKDLGMHREAFRLMEMAYAWRGEEDYYIRLGYQESLLKHGFWDRAWDIEDSRPTQKGAAFDLRLPAKVKKWRGETLPDGHLLIVINEGGFGDRLSYARWLPMLTEMGINWKFYPYAPTLPFFDRIFPRDRIIRDGDDITPDPTHWTTTFGLPQDLRALPTTIPEPLPILADDAMVDKFKIHRVDNLPVIGLCYEAGEAFQGGRKVRSMTEGQAMRLVTSTMHKIHWVNLQWRTKMPYPVTNTEADTWEEYAGLVSNLDGVVSVDTGTYHLAAGMGKRLAVVLAANSCWKFGLNYIQDPWYSTARLYRNKTVGMEDAITELIQDILQEKIFKVPA